MAQTDDYDSHNDSAWFRDQLRQRDRLIAELTSELDKSADLIRRFNEYIHATRKKLGEFEMELTDLDLETTLGDEDWKLVADWNKHGHGLTALLVGVFTASMVKESVNFTVHLIRSIAYRSQCRVCLEGLRKELTAIPQHHCYQHHAGRDGAASKCSWCGNAAHGTG
jgi:hypothetical protein